MNQLQDDEFECIAINDYSPRATDELDLVQDRKYTIIQTSASGWWYAVNEEGEDGWIPSNYLQRTPIQASKYYNLLIHGYVRDIEKKLQLIPNDIKTLCIHFYYKFLMYNEYCDVQFKKGFDQFDVPKLLIQASINIKHETSDKIPFLCRLVSRLPINIQDNISNCGISKVSIKIIHGEEFECIAISDYSAQTSDELDLIENRKYTIIQTSSSGWWYAVNEDGKEAWVPSNYLERMLDDSYGKIIIGVTTNPESFMNASIAEQPFGRCDVKHMHAIGRVSTGIIIVENGKAKDIEVDGGIMKDLIFDIWVENNKVNICESGIKKIFEKDVLRDSDGNIMDYYFVMCFTDTSNKHVKFEISGGFI